MPLHQKNRLAETSTLLSRTAKRIAPLWSLENFVAVNPYLGLSDMAFSEAMDFLHRSGQVQPTLPVGFFLQALRAGKMDRAHIAAALAHDSHGLEPDADRFIARLLEAEPAPAAPAIRTMCDLANEINGKRWERFVIDRISFWASAYFDRKQAVWNTTDQRISLFASWKKEAEVDLSPEAMGLRGFRKFVRALPDDHLAAAAEALAALDLSEPVLDHYLTGLTLKMNGWAGFAARIDWDAGLAGQPSHATEEFMAILLVWEMALKQLLPYASLDEQWQRTKHYNRQLLADPAIDERLAQQLVLQDAFDRANQQALIEKINGRETAPSYPSEPKAQAIFCIDVRSEVFRRHLEAADADIETMGFAGFFAFPISYLPFAHAEGSNQCPVLLTPSYTIHESLGDERADRTATARRTLKEQLGSAWKSFKSGAISCFGFVSPLGLYFLPKLLTDAFGITRPLPRPEEVGLSRTERADAGVQLRPDGVTGIPPAERLQLATSALKAMSLTENFARTVLIVGHGASTVNNPHATGLDCGACGGHSGEANAKVAAAVLNDADVRTGLLEAGIAVPETTLFVAALHDTTTDEVRLFEPRGGWPSSHESEIREIRSALQLAGANARTERGARMRLERGDVSRQVLQRSKDWSQVRPEWGLAGCSSFIVAPRRRTAGLDLAGKAFMHNYDWKKDRDFGVLELIMTAPMVVTSWINLQYYASTADNKRFGAGNKTLHNVVGGLGVLEGFGGDLRVGLPWQSVHDGTRFQHEPRRLNVLIEAPVDAMSRILAKHDSIRQLCDHGWIYLFAMNEAGQVAYKYIGELEWERV